MYFNNACKLLIAVVFAVTSVMDVYAYEYDSVCPIGPTGTIGGSLYLGDKWIPYNPKNPGNSEYWKDHRGFAQCNCTSYAAEMSKIKWNDELRNAENWDNRARALGWPISTTVPIPGAVIQWDAGDGPAGSVGHVGSIADIDFNGIEITGLRYTDWNARGDHNGPGDRSIASNHGDYTSAHFIYTEFPEAGEYVSTDGSTKSICLHDYPKKNYSVCWEYATGGSDVCENAQRNFVFQSDSENGICYAPQTVGINLCPPKETYVDRDLSGNPDVVSYSSPTGVFSSIGGFGGGSVPMSGPGFEAPATDEAIPNLPDFIVRKTWLVTPWGDETYKFGLNESFDTKAQSENIGDGPCVSGEIDTITGHFYLSKGYKMDPSSGEGARRRIDSTTTRCDNLKPGDTHTETKNTVISQWITEPGIYNIVYCIDHPENDHKSRLTERNYDDTIVPSNLF